MASGSPLGDALPCPGCGYDLRAQTTPACPECGRTFESIDDLRAAVAGAQRVYLRVVRWRQRIALGLLFGFLGGCTVGPILTLAMGLPEWAAVAVGIAGYLTALAASASALVLLVQVCRWRFDRRIAREQRRELTGSIFVCLVYALPLLLLVPLILAWLA